MLTFLEETAVDIIGKYGSSLVDFCCILPSKRSAHVFKLALRRVANSAIELPVIYSMDDFINHLAQARTVDPLLLQLELFDLLKEHDPELDFEQFSGWARVLLEDFSRLDKYLVDTDQLFAFMSAVKAMERWQLEGSAPTPSLDKHFQLWQHLAGAYQTLKATLASRGEAYPGMAYREVAENVDRHISNTSFARFAFIGLNALSKAEEVMISYLVEQGKADLYWDADAFYMAPDQNLKAGQFLRQYKTRFGKENWRPESNGLLQTEKEIQLLGVSNATLQGKVVSELLQQLNHQHPGSTIAVVLPDENLLLPVLHSLSDLEDTTITMGLCLTGTSLFNFVELLFELHQTSVNLREGPKQGIQYNHRAVIKLLTHPYILRYEKYIAEQVLHDPNLKAFSQDLVRQIVRENLVLISESDIAAMAPKHPLLVKLFAPWQTHHQALAGLFDFVQLFRAVYKTERSAIELEYFYLLFTILKRIETIFDNAERSFSLRSFKKFLYEQLNQTSLPFEGAGVSQVQIMGLLETRALDFDHVIVLSVNEDTLPSVSLKGSLLPFDALMQFGLPSHADQESITAYHFYRLLQRARTVHLLHVLPSETYGAAEPSRFIHQLRDDLIPRNPGLRLTEQLASVAARTVATETDVAEQTIVIPKEGATLQELKDVIVKGLSPSAINSFITCSLQFYFNRLARLREADTVTDTLGADQFGSVVHKVLEDLLAPFLQSGEPVLPGDLELMVARVDEMTDKAFRELVKGQTTGTGMNHLLRQVAAQVLRNFLKKQAQQNDGSSVIIGLETKLNAILHSPVSLPFQLQGIADRIDILNGQIRVIDYKTSYIKSDELQAGPNGLAHDLVHHSGKGKLRQLWLYKYMAAKALLHLDGCDEELKARLSKAFLATESTPSVVAGIISFRDPQARLLEAKLSFTEGETLEQFVSHSEEILQQLQSVILSPDQPFRKTDDIEACSYCPYTTICSRAER